MPFVFVIIGFLYGLLLLVIGAAIGGAGSGSGVLLLLFAAPFGLNLLYVPVWWATMFGVVAFQYNKVFSWSVFIVGECLHFWGAAYWLYSLEKDQWVILFRLLKIPVLAIVVLFGLGAYIAGHVFMLKMLMRTER